MRRKEAEAGKIKWLTQGDHWSVTELQPGLLSQLGALFHTMFIIQTKTENERLNTIS